MTYRQNMGVGSASAVAGAVRRLGSRRVNMYFTPDIAVSLTTDLAATRTVTVGDSVDFTVAASGGTAPYLYAFYHKKESYEGYTLLAVGANPTYNIAAVALDDAGYYVCEVQDSTGQPLFSTEQLLTVNPAP